MAVAVRCTGCRGASQVATDAIGMLVQCPMCHEPFLALEEAAVVVRSAARPVRPVPPPAKPRPRTVAEPVHDHTTGSEPPPRHNGGLPISVLFGLALLPLAIPLLWLIGPLFLPKPPSLSLAAPVSLAFSASVLCLAVVLTVDWTPMTRIKGVLILVGLSYFTGLSLYFLKHEIVTRVKDFLTPALRWHKFERAEQKWSVNFPGPPEGVKSSKEQPIGATAGLKCVEYSTPFFLGSARYVAGSGPDLVQLPEERFFNKIERDLVENLPSKDASFDGRRNDGLFQGGEARRWEFEWSDASNRRIIRVVRVVRLGGSVYYQSVQGENLDPDSDTFVKPFLASLQIGPPLGK